MNLLDLSTHHLPEVVCDQLSAYDGVTAHDTTYGWLLGVPGDLDGHRTDHPTTVPDALQQDFAEHPPGSWLLRHVPWTRAEHRISAVNADATQSTQLQTATGTACLVIDRRTWRGDRPVTWVRQWFIGSAYDLVARFAPGLR